jgi:hypothetical protein
MAHSKIIKKKVSESWQSGLKTFKTHPLLERVPLRQWIVKNFILQTNHDFAEKIIATEHV